MRKTIATLCATSALMFGGAGIANAATIDSPFPASTTTVAQTEDTDHGDNTGLWGLAGLLGLLGLLGLKRRNDQPVTGAAGTAGYGGAPRT